MEKVEEVINRIENDIALTLSIKNWAQDDRPREKLLAKGKEALSNAELLAILLGSGSRNESAVQLAQRILADVDNDLIPLGQKGVKELTQFKGVGEAKAITIIAAIELARRRQLTDTKSKPKITTSEKAYKLLAPIFQDKTIEEFWILLLNRNNRVTDQCLISSGGVSGTVVDAKVVFKQALETLSSGIILAHNHPSGNTHPSQNDINLTQKLVTAGKSLDITILDHLIIASDGYYSFRDEGLIES